MYKLIWDITIFDPEVIQLKTDGQLKSAPFFLPIAICKI